MSSRRTRIKSIKRSASNHAKQNAKKEQVNKIQTLPPVEVVIPSGPVYISRGKGSSWLQAADNLRREFYLTTGVPPEQTGVWIQSQRSNRNERASMSLSKRSRHMRVGPSTYIFWWTLDKDVDRPKTERDLLRMNRTTIVNETRGVDIPWKAAQRRMEVEIPVKML